MISYVLTEYHTWSKFAIRKQRTIVSNYIKGITYRIREHKWDDDKRFECQYNYRRRPSQ